MQDKKAVIAVSGIVSVIVASICQIYHSGVITP